MLQKTDLFQLHSLQLLSQKGARILSNDAGQLKRYRDTRFFSQSVSESYYLTWISWRNRSDWPCSLCDEAAGEKAPVDNIQPF